MSLAPRRPRCLERRASVLAALGVAVVIGCQVIVASDLPDFACTGESASACPSGMVCDARIGRCVASGVLADDAGEDAEEDAADAGIDVDAGPAPVGAPCRVDGDCASNLCGTSTILTTTITSAAGPVCTKTCCVSADCPAGFVCFGGGTGGNYCVEAAKAQRSPPATGGKSAGEACGGNNQCRSGHCKLGRCLDTCCRVADCAGGTTCRVSTVDVPTPEHDAWVCAPPPPSATKNAGEACALVDDCKNDNCVGSGDAGANPRVCRPSCCNEADCMAQMPTFPNAQCAYSTSATDQLKWCFPTSNTLGSANDKSCSTNQECQSSYCDAEMQRCLAVCCVDSDCPPTHACRPSGASTPFLRCVPAAR